MYGALSKPAFQNTGAGQMQIRLYRIQFHDDIINLKVEANNEHINITGNVQSSEVLDSIGQIAKSVSVVTTVTNNAGRGSDWMW